MSEDICNLTDEQLKALGGIRICYSKRDLEMAAECLRLNKFSIARAFVAFQSSKPEWDTEFTIELLEDLNRVRRGEEPFHRWTKNAFEQWSIKM